MSVRKSYSSKISPPLQWGGINEHNPEFLRDPLLNWNKSKCMYIGEFSSRNIMLFFISFHRKNSPLIWNLTMGIEVESSKGWYAMVDDLEYSPQSILGAITWLRHYISWSGLQWHRYKNSIFSANPEKLALINIPSLPTYKKHMRQVKFPSFLNKTHIFSYDC